MNLRVLCPQKIPLRLSQVSKHSILVLSGIQRNPTRHIAFRDTAREIYDSCIEAASSLRGPRKQGVNYADCAALIEYAGGRSAYFPPSLVGSDSVAPPLILAVDEPETRNAAGKSLIGFITERNEDSESPDSKVSSINYAFSRLTKGLSSSRESARQGFSCCLTELLSLGVVCVDDTIIAIDEVTKITGSLKRGEERDFMLGKLFGCLAIMKSSKLSEATHIQFIVDTFMKLHHWKGWIREIITESILHLISIIPIKFTREIVFPAITPFLQTPVSELAAWQVVLISGIEDIALSHKKILEILQLVLPNRFIFDSTTLEALVPTLTAACAGYPKIHRVWNCILLAIFPSIPRDSTRQLRPHRCKEVTEVNSELLHSFVTFVDSHLVTNSHEKRGVAFQLLLEIFGHCPVPLLPVCMSKKLLRSIFAARSNKKHTLHYIANETLKALVTSVGSDNEAKLCVASLLIQHCSPNFDPLSHTSTIQALLTGLSDSDITSHAQTLCGIVGDQYRNLQLTESKPALNSIDVNDSQKGDDEIENQKSTREQAIFTIQSALDGLVSLARNPTIKNRFVVSVIAGLVLIRVTLFANDNESILDLVVSGGTVEGKKKKLSKTCGNSVGLASLIHTIFGSDSSITASTLSDIFMCLRLAEVGTMSTSTASANTSAGNSSFPDEIISFASSKLLSLMADMGFKSPESMVYDSASTIVQSDHKIKRSVISQPSSTIDPKSSLLQVLFELFALCCDNGYVLREDSSTTAVDSSQSTARGVIKTVQNSYNHINDMIISYSVAKSAGSKTAVKQLKLCESLLAYTSLGVFHVLALELELDVLEDISDIIVQIANGDRNDKLIIKSDDDGDYDGPQVKLFETCMEFLSATEDQSVKGIRDAIKRMWIALVDAQPIESDVFDAVLGLIVDDDGKEDDSNNGRVDGDSIYDDEEVDNDDDQKPMNVSDKRVQEENAQSDDNDDNDDDDDDDDDDDREVHVKHSGTPEQDEALASLIEMRKASRKRGLLQAQRRHYLIRTRAIDIFEVIIETNTDNAYQLSLILPFVKTLKTIHSTANILNIQEVSSFEHKLRILVEEKICRNSIKKAQSNLKDLDTIERNSTGKVSLLHIDFVDVVNELFLCLRTANSELKQTLTLCIYRVAKSVLNTFSTNDTNSNTEAMISAKSCLQTNLEDAIKDFQSNKNSKFPRKFFEEIFVRFPEYSIAILAKHVIDGIAYSKGPYLQTECCELITNVLHRFKSLPLRTREHIFCLTPSLLENAAHVMHVISNGEITKSNDLIQSSGQVISSVAAKRLKALAVCIKEAMQSSKIYTAQTKAPPISSVEISKSFSLVRSTLTELATKLFQNGTMNAITDESANEPVVKHKFSGPIASLAQAVKNAQILLDDTKPLMKQDKIPKHSKSVDPSERVIATPDRKRANGSERHCDATASEKNMKAAKKHKIDFNGLDFAKPTDNSISRSQIKRRKEVAV